MAPAKCSSEQYKEYFKQTKQIFEELKAKDIEGVKMDVLSMGMSDSYAEAVECGIIDEVGGLDRALEVLREMSASTCKKDPKNKNKNNSYSKK